jgi:hypothetical protein
MAGAMNVLGRIVFAAAVAGLIAGGLVTLAHHFGTTLISPRPKFTRARHPAEAEARVIDRELCHLVDGSPAARYMEADWGVASAS